MFKLVAQSKESSLIHQNDEILQDALRRSYGNAIVYDLERFRKTIGAIRTDLDWMQGLVLPGTSPHDAHDFLFAMSLSNRNVESFVNPSEDGRSIDDIPLEVDCPSIPTSWFHIFGLVDEDICLCDKFRERLLARFSHVTESNKIINRVFSAEGRLDVSPHLSEDIRMFYYIYFIALRSKDQGNQYFKDGIFRSSIKLYEKAVQYICILGENLMKRLLIWEKSFTCCCKPSEEWKCSLHEALQSELPHAKRLNGLVRSFRVLQQLYHRYGKTAINDTSSSEEVAEQLRFDEKEFTLYTKKAYGYFLLDFLYNKSVCFLVTVLSNLSATYLKESSDKSNCKNVINACLFATKILETKMIHHEQIIYPPNLLPSWSTYSGNEGVAASELIKHLNAAPFFPLDEYACVFLSKDIQFSKEVVGKVYFRYGTALFQQNKYDEAEKMLMKSKDESPKETVAVEKLLNELKVKRASEKKALSARLKSMFG
jgi:tetratricopeptide (TPR) repeat protein